LLDLTLGFEPVVEIGAVAGSATLIDLVRPSGDRVEIAEAVG
jgi:hypothetical protein